MAEQLISTAVLHTLPHSYIRSESEWPRLDADIPVVDLANPDSAAVVYQIGAACSSHGLFQVLNHGLPVEAMRAAMALAHDFFRLSPEEKAKLYSDDPPKKMRLSTSFNVRKETVHNWRDYLRLHCHPLEQFVPAEGPANPPPLRNAMGTYCKEVRDLGFQFYGAISKSLGLEQDYINKVLGEQEQHMAANFDPKCPSPELTYNALTILMMDEQVTGLRVLKEGRWIAVNLRPNTFIINLGRAAGDTTAAGAEAGGGAVCGREGVDAATRGGAVCGTEGVGAATRGGAVCGTEGVGAEAGGTPAIGSKEGGAAKVSAAARMMNALANVTSAIVSIVQCANADVND
ncbi:flavanone 3-dioxygenase 2-like isoform X2 [Hordeum vulgare subsp. vulgare]|uniref:Non-haem dioxygenase N-terminal domain-containing protein n=1 Tax=Hordeum vulgare subsp. vulgare TaxID=112509 RepID=A0A8I6XVK9_HORVV|nr:flavanone 3-dioxygenase 2-like isoform X2 [Hordeum vulgare subsp. vulgare]